MSIIIKNRNPEQVFSKALTHLKEVQFTQKDLEKLDVRKKATKIRYLNQSYLFHLVALWEKFIEDLALYGFKELTKNTNLGVATPLMNSYLDYFAKGMNSPKRENIDKFFMTTLGIRKISSVWEWDGMPRDRACEILDKIMDARNEIGHTSHTNEVLSFEKNFDYMKHLYNLAYLTQFEVDKLIAERLGEKFNRKEEIPYPTEKSTK